MRTFVQSPDKLIEVFWIEKYLTFSQNHRGELISTDHLFLAEYALSGAVSDASRFTCELRRQDDPQVIARYTGDDKLWCNHLWVNRKVRSYDTLAKLEQACPATDVYAWTINGNEVSGCPTPIRIGGVQGKSQFPRAHAMRLSQSGKPVANFNALDASTDLRIDWDSFEGAKRGGVIDDTIFLFVSDCHGRVVHFGGLPTEADRIGFDSTSTCISAGTLSPGRPYTIFFSQCRMVDQDGSDGVINVAVNSFGVELDVRTTGNCIGEPCPEPPGKAPFLWKRKTRIASGLETWPTITEGVWPSDLVSTGRVI